MKKTTKSVVKKTTAKKPAVKKSPAKPKRKAQGESEVVTLVERLAAITEQLAMTAERLALLAQPVQITKEQVIVEDVLPEEGPDIADAEGEE